MYFFREKRTVLAAAALSMMISFVSFLAFETRCFGNQSCSVEFLNGFIKIIFWLSIYILVLFTWFLFFSRKIFLSWFKKIFWWFLPLSLLLVFQTDVYGGPVSFDRFWVLNFLMAILAVITVAFTFKHKT